MKENKENPICPKCHKRMQKIGFLGTLKGRKQRFRCNYCGFSLTDMKEIEVVMSNVK